MSWARVEQVQAIATRREPSPEQAITLLTLTSSLSTPLTSSPHPTSTTTMALLSSVLLSTPLELCLIHITLARCPATTPTMVGPTSQQPNSHSSSSDQGM